MGVWPWARTHKPLTILTLLVLGSLAATLNIRTVEASDGAATIYFLSLTNPEPPFDSLSGPMDKSQLTQGAIDAATPKQRLNSIPAAHLKWGKDSPYFYRAVLTTVTSWGQYADIVSRGTGAIILNAHGETTPVPQGWSKESWVDKIAEAMYKRGLTWINTGGYPFYNVFYQASGSKELWGVQGFQRLMSWAIGTNSVTLWPPSTPGSASVSSAAATTIYNGLGVAGWLQYTGAFQVRIDRPLKRTDFKDLLAMPLYERTVDAEIYWEGAVLVFGKPGTRFDSTHTGFGNFVHLGTGQTFDNANNPTNTDYHRAYMTVAAALWTEATRLSPRTETSSTTISPGRRELTLHVSPVVLGAYTVGVGQYVIRLGFGLYGGELFAASANDPVKDVVVRINRLARTDILLRADTQLSRNGEEQGIKLQNTYYSDPNAALLVNTANYMIGFIPGTAPFTRLVGGVMLASNWGKTLAGYSSPQDFGGGVDRFHSSVWFGYKPVLRGTESSDKTEVVLEFQSMILIDVQVTTGAHDWRVIPIGYNFHVNTGAGHTVEVGGRVPISVFNGGTVNGPVTIFHEDFDGDTFDWRTGDNNPSGDLDYWGLGGIAITMEPFEAWAAQVGDNSVKGVSNAKATCGLVTPGCYDKGMNAYLEHDLWQLNLRAYRSVTITYWIQLMIKSGDALYVEVLSPGGGWSLVKSYPGDDVLHVWYWETPLSIGRDAQAIRFRFVSNDDTLIWRGVEIDHIEINGEVPNDSPYNWQDAGNDFTGATLVSAGEHYGYLMNDAGEPEDWYQFSVTQIGSGVLVDLRNLAIGERLLLELRDPNNNRVLGGETCLAVAAQSTGSWRVRVYSESGYGSYKLIIRTDETTGCGAGGSPYVHVWNGTGFSLDNNLLPASARGYSGTDLTDWYLLQKHLVTDRRGHYNLMLRELEQDHSFFDQTQLWAVDHAQDVNVAVSPTGQVLTYQDPVPPNGAVDETGRDATGLLSAQDGLYYEGSVGSFLTLDFGALDVGSGAKFVLRADPPCSPGCKQSILVQTLASSGSWQTVAVVIPRVYWSIDIVDLSGYLPDALGEVRVRLYFTLNHRVDFAGLDTTPEAPVDTRSQPLLAATSTAYGDLTGQMRTSDNVYAELYPDQTLFLVFDSTPQTNRARSFIIVVEGYYVPV